MKDLRADAVGTVGLAALVGIVTWFIGLDVLQSGLLATAFLTAGAGRVLTSSLGAARGEERWRRRTAHAPHGTRSEVIELAWRLTGPRRSVSSSGARRVRELARHRLARHGVDLDDPRDAEQVRRLLGSSVQSVLAADPTRPVRYVEVMRCIEVLERLEDPTGVRHRRQRPADPLTDPTADPATATSLEPPR